uniref:Putative secreted protein n=1 Tax=Anopheles darlingi TaxID=43151 RepID=A0A2M4D693_ANODA
MASLLGFVLPCCCAVAVASSFLRRWRTVDGVTGPAILSFLAFRRACTGSSLSPAAGAPTTTDAAWYSPGRRCSASLSCWIWLVVWCACWVDDSQQPR